jgi:preprotein translocase subunit SecE
LATETIEQTTSDAPRGPLGWWQRTTEFFADVQSEMKRVTWPTRREVYATTVVVILTSTFFGLYLFGVDLMFSAAIQWVLRRFGAGAV